MNMQTIIEQKISVAREKLSEKAQQKNTPSEMAEVPFQGLLFVGNRHETVPLRLLTDKYLSPRAKTAWQMIKLNAYQFQGTAFPSYNELSLWLSDRAFQGKPISRKLVSQTLLLLRLTRWLTLCETVRNEKGQVLGNVYIMNDEPLSVADCLHLNNDYLRLLEKSVKHNDPLVKDVASAIIDELLNDKHLSHFISHLDLIRTRYHQQQEAIIKPILPPTLTPNAEKVIEGTQQNLLSSKMELSQNERELSQKSRNSPSSNLELGASKVDNPLILDKVPNRNSANVQYSTYISTYSKYSTRLKALKLTQVEMDTIEKALSPLSEDVCEAILIEAEQRIAVGNVRKPASYLFSLIKRANTGEFKAYYQQKCEVKAEHKATKSVNSARHIIPMTDPELPTNPPHLAMLAKITQRIRGNQVIG